MTPSLRLFAIETRRNVGLWAFPVLAGLALLAWYLDRNELNGTFTSWPEASVAIGFAVVFLGPAAGGLAAWAAGRDDRRGLTELLATLPAPVMRRELTLLAATALWALLAYLAAGAYQVVNVAREATWGRPVAAPILIAGLAIAVQAAIGYAAGSFAGSRLASRLVAALVPVGLFFAQLLPTLLPGDDVQVGPRSRAGSLPYENLSPAEVVNDLGGSIFSTAPPEIVWGSVAWLLGLGGLALALITLRLRWRSPVGWGTLAAAALALVVGWTQLVPAPVFVAASPSRVIAYEPVCVRSSIEICLHPAYESALDETAELVDSVIGPLVGLPGFPVRAEQVRPLREAEWLNPLEGGAVDSDALVIAPALPGRNDAGEAGLVAVAAVDGQAGEYLGELTPAQSALALWLMNQAGWIANLDDWDWWSAGGLFIPAVSAKSEVSTIEEGDAALAVMDEVLLAAERFGALSPAEQHAWLEANFAALRAGELRLEDLP